MFLFEPVKDFSPVLIYSLRSTVIPVVISFRVGVPSTHVIYWIYMQTVRNNAELLVGSEQKQISQQKNTISAARQKSSASESTKLEFNFKHQSLPFCVDVLFHVSKYNPF